MYLLGSERDIMLVRWCVGVGTYLSKRGWGMEREKSVSVMAKGNNKMPRLNSIHKGSSTLLLA